MHEQFIESSPDRRNDIALQTANLLETIQNAPSSRVAAENDTPDYIPYAELANISMVLGAILPMTFTVWDQRNSKSMSFQMLVNPENVNWGKTNATQLQYTRQGFLSQLWGANQETISATGRTAAFMVRGEGLSTIGQRRSFAFKNLMALLATYKNNGYEFFDPLKEGQLTRVINRARGVILTYDGSSLLGHFNNFTLDNDAEHPYSMNYNFEFIVSNSSGVYKEIRGHFLPPVELSTNDKAARLVNDVTPSNVSEQPNIRP